MEGKSIIAGFIGGAIIGSLATWSFVKKKYEKIAQDEIDSVKKVFSKRDSESSEAEENDDKYASILHEEGYVNYSDISDKNGEEVEEVEKPYVISPEEFGEIEEYEKISLTYYSDGVLADENDEVVDDVDGVIGEESLTHFGEYEDDSVFVRNDSLRSDYEILMDHRKFSDVIKDSPHRREV